MNYLIGSLVALLLVFTANVGQYLNNTKALAGVPVGSEYHSTTTRAYNGNTLTNLTVLKNEPGTLGSITITGANTSVLNIYDATTTNSSLRTKTATTTLATIPASAAAGTYTFDLVATDGIIFEWVGSAVTVPTSTITFR